MRNPSVLKRTSMADELCKRLFGAPLSLDFIYCSVFQVPLRFSYDDAPLLHSEKTKGRKKTQLQVFGRLSVHAEFFNFH